VQDLVEFHQVSQALYRYASCVDKKDWTALRTLFTDDATAKYGDYPLLEGGDAIVAFVAEASEKRSWLHHLVSVYHVDVDGDEATALTYHTSHQIDKADPDSVGVIVARYHDRLRRIDGAWKIASKEMEIGWRERRSSSSFKPVKQR
jgi:3-phenylpropionate/cinnamic acid dioxygenase small subunit